MHCYLPIGYYVKPLQDYNNSKWNKGNVRRKQRAYLPTRTMWLTEYKRGFTLTTACRKKSKNLISCSQSVGGDSKKVYPFIKIRVGDKTKTFRTTIDPKLLPFASECIVHLFLHCTHLRWWFCTNRKRWTCSSACDEASSATWYKLYDHITIRTGRVDAGIEVMMRTDRPLDD